MSEELSLQGAEVAITGRLLSMSRAEAVERLREAGGTHVREPGFSTTMLLVGESSGQLTPDGRISRSLELFRELKGKGFGIRRILRTTGLGESDVEDRIAGLYPETGSVRLTVLASPGQIDLHVSSFSEISEAAAAGSADALTAELKSRLADFIFAETASHRGPPTPSL